MKPKYKQHECPHCNGAGGYYWDAPVYHNERQREWATCRMCEYESPVQRKRTDNVIKVNFRKEKY